MTCTGAIDSPCLQLKVCAPLIPVFARAHTHRNTRTLREGGDGRKPQRARERELAHARAAQCVCPLTLGSKYPSNFAAFPWTTRSVHNERCSRSCRHACVCARARVRECVCARVRACFSSWRLCAREQADREHLADRRGAGDAAHKGNVFHDGFQELVICAWSMHSRVAVSEQSRSGAFARATCGSPTLSRSMFCGACGESPSASKRPEPTRVAPVLTGFWAGWTASLLFCQHHAA